MKTYMYKALCLLIISNFIIGTVYAQSPKNKAWNFKNLEGWEYAHQDKNPDNQCIIKKGKLRIFTEANSWDRKKIRTNDKIYTTGRYTWKTYIPEMGKGDQASVGSWIYCDDRHEIDFEVGYGKQAVREKLKAKSNEMIAYATTQANPFKSVPVKIKTGWHIFEIDLTLVNGNYKVEWIIDDKIISTVQQTYGNEYAFYIFCSVENLKFIGDHQPKEENYGIFDYVKYKYHK